MARSTETLKGFVFSTDGDLHDYRAVARNVILELGWVPESKETFGSMPGTTLSECRAKIESSDIFLLLVAFRRGWVPTAAELVERSQDSRKKFQRRLRGVLDEQTAMLYVASLEMLLSGEGPYERVAARPGRAMTTEIRQPRASNRLESNCDPAHYYRRGPMDGPSGGGIVHAWISCAISGS